MNSEEIRVGIIGCGRIARTSYLPAVQHVKELKVNAVVDAVLPVARDTASHFEIPFSTSRYEDLFGHVDAVFLLVPHHLHAAIAIDFLERGVSVLCEKPLARTFEECTRMIEASKRGNATLALALVRRFFPPSQLVKMILDQRWLGPISNIDVEYGFVPAGPVARPPTCGWLYNREQAGGGILISDGIHVLDLLLWWLGGEPIIETYEDDGFSGVEAEVSLRLGLRCGGDEITATIHLSLLRKLRNTIIITAENGVIEASVHRSSQVTIRPKGFSDVNDDRYLTLGVSEHEKLQTDPFVSQLQWFASAVQGKHTGLINETTCLRAMQVIDACYASRKWLLHPWEQNGWRFTPQL